MSVMSKLRLVELPARLLLDGAACPNGGAAVMFYVTCGPHVTDTSEQDACAPLRRPKHDGDKAAGPR